MGRITRQAAKAAKARLSGAIPSNSPKNKKIAFGKDDDDLESKIDEGENAVDTVDADISGNVNEDIDGKEDGDDEDKCDDEDDAVEEVTGSAARESMQRLRDEERKVVKEATSKKKRRKKDDVVVEELESGKNEDSQSNDENEEEDDEDETEFTYDFFKMVDKERAVQLQKAKTDRKRTKILQQKTLGKHTTFVVDGDYEMLGAPHKVERNIEVVALGGGGDEESSTHLHTERQLIISATLGSAPSKAAVTFARGSMTCGTTKERSSESRKRKSKDEETWKRSRKLNRLGIGSRPGHAATLFVCKKK
ncbi:hypothetical protein ACHAXA_008095 [Cyclostephanos tholiformis]|uniref:Uncharacterized protein n=1 Tax=Cyclostephanos tholiformis TaxID=382380 RepID=A0ABD3RVQ1_9STRA